MNPGSQDAAALPGSTVRPGRPAGLVEKLIAAVRPECRTDVLVFDPRDPVFGGPACAAGCQRPARRRGLCPGHYERWRVAGKPDLAEFAAGLLACVRLPDAGAEEATTDCLPRYREVFAERCHLLAELFCGADDGLRLQTLIRVARQHRLPLVAANDVHYHDASRQPLQDVLTAVRHGTTVAELGHRRFPNAERHLKSPAEMRRLFAECPEAVSRTVELAGRCKFSLDELRYEYPEELCPAGLTPIEHLSRHGFRTLGE